MDTTKTIYVIVSGYAGVDVASVTDDTKLVDDLYFDSLELMGLATEIETELDIEIPDETFTAAMTVGQVIDAVNKIKGV